MPNMQMKQIFFKLKTGHFLHTPLDVRNHVVVELDHDVDVPSHVLHQDYGCCASRL